MLKKIIGAAIGAKLAKNSPAVGGATGAALGAAVPWVLGRLSIAGMIALAAGGYVAKRVLDRKEPQAYRKPTPPAPVPVAAQTDD
ncbi:hypothetical protein [Erythrobacter colymbi]|uniref:hypothetical protein n=1 Tax=Erythrobacter colymbi TaxID=1161202 RepID=UPI000A389C4D|nr:hypothetical protein [Erythrobacter colymbi]